jgi:hypothetical protein
MKDILDFQPFVSKDFLPSEFYEEVYIAVDSQIAKNLAEGKDAYAEPFSKAVCENNGFIVLFECVPDEVYDFFQEKMSEAFGVKTARPNLLFARYTHDSGFAPRLLPHADRAVETQSVTMTVELDSTLDWDIYVEDERFELGKNTGVFFSGSHQIHFRPHKDFKKDDYYDILLVQGPMLEPGQKEMTDENHFNYMEKKAGNLVEKYRDILEGSLENRGESA